MIPVTIPLLFFSIASVLVLELVIFQYRKKLSRNVVVIEELDSALDTLNLLSSLLLTKSLTLGEIASKTYSSPYIKNRYESLTLISINPTQIARNENNGQYENIPTPLESYVVNLYVEKQKKSTTPQILKIEGTVVVPIFYQNSSIGYLVLFGKKYEPLAVGESDYLNAMGSSIALIFKSMQFDKTLDAKEQFKAINIPW